MLMNMQTHTEREENEMKNGWVLYEVVESLSKGRYKLKGFILKKCFVAALQ